MCGYFCIGFINFIVEGKSLQALRIFFHQIIKENDDIIINYFMNDVKKWLNAIPLKHLIYIQI